MQYVATSRLKIEGNTAKYSLPSDTVDRWKNNQSGLTPYFTLDIENLYGFGKVKSVKEDVGSWTIVCEDSNAEVKVIVWAT